MDCASGLCDLLQFAPKVGGKKLIDIGLGGTCQIPCMPEVWAVEGHDDCVPFANSQFGIKRVTPRHAFTIPEISSSDDEYEAMDGMSDLFAA